MHVTCHVLYRMSLELQLAIAGESSLCDELGHSESTLLDKGLISRDSFTQ